MMDSVHLSHVQLFATSWTTAHQASLSFTIVQSLLKLMSIESVMPSNTFKHEVWQFLATPHLTLYHLILYQPLLQPSIFPGIRVFSDGLALHIRWPKYWSFSFSLSRSNEYSGLISFRIDWFNFLAVQRTLKGLLQHHNAKASILQHSIWCKSHIHMWLLEKKHSFFFFNFILFLNFT